MADDYDTIPLSPEEVKVLMAEQQGYEATPLTPGEIAALQAEAPPPPKGVDPGRWGAFWRNALAGFFKQGSDEAAGLVTLGAVDTSMPGVAWRDSSGTPQFLHTPQDVYRAGRDSERANLKAAQENRPGFSLAGSMAGDVASDAVINTLLGVPVASSTYQTAAGALSGLLGSDADLTGEKRTPESMQQAGAETALGGALGYAAPKVGTAIGKAAPVLLRKARGALEGAAVGMGRRVLQGGSDLAGARFKEVPADAILEAIRSGGILPLGTTQGAFKRLEALAKTRGAGYGALIQDLEEKGFSGPEVQPLVEALLARADEMAGETITSGAPSTVLRRAGERLDDVARGGKGMQGPPVETIPLTQAETIKRKAQEEAKYGLLSDTPVNEAKQEVASKVRQAIEDAIETQGVQFPEDSIERTLAESFVPEKQRLARTLAARNLAEKGTARLAGRNAVGLREAIMGSMLSGGGVATGADPLSSLVGGMGTAAALSMASRRLPSAGASTAYGLSRLAGGLANQPQALETAGTRAATSMARGMPQMEALADYLLEEKRKKDKGRKK